MNWLGLEGKVAVVTGAGGGIGKAIAAAFGEAGARVALLDLNGETVAAAARETGGKAIVCDVTSDDSVARAVAEGGRSTMSTDS